MKGTTIKSVWPIESATLRVYCLCGGAIHLTTKPDDEYVSIALEAFAEAHRGNGHGPCSSKEAAKARRRQDKR
jgi:hypothetical protein